MDTCKAKTLLVHQFHKSRLDSLYYKEPVTLIHAQSTPPASLVPRQRRHTPRVHHHFHALLRRLLLERRRHPVHVHRRQENAERAGFPLRHRDLLEQRQREQRLRAAGDHPGHHPTRHARGVTFPRGRRRHSCAVPRARRVALLFVRVCHLVERRGELAGLRVQPRARRDEPAPERDLLHVLGEGGVLHDTRAVRPHDVVASKVERHPDVFSVLDRGVHAVGGEIGRGPEERNQDLDGLVEPEWLARGAQGLLNRERGARLAAGREHGRVLEEGDSLVLAVGLGEQALALLVQGEDEVDGHGARGCEWGLGAVRVGGCGDAVPASVGLSPEGHRG